MSHIGLEQLRILRTAEGRQALAAAALCAEVVEPAMVGRLRARFAAELVSAALTLNGLRVRAKERFVRGEEMFFDGSDLLEQATSEPVARHKAGRFAEMGEIADLCCGAGGDGLFLAEHVGRVIGVDCSPARLLCLQGNAEAYGVGGRVRAVAADIEQWVPRAEGCHIDPPRREGGRRQLQADQWAPWIERVRGLAGLYGNLGAKLSPAVDLGQLGWADEVECISENGTLKQAMAWCGQLARSRRTATVIRSTAGQTKAIETLASDAPVSRPARGGLLAAGVMLHEPDAAVVRAGLLGNLAERIGAGLVDPHLPLLGGEMGGTSEAGAATLLARRYEVLEVVGWSSKKIKQLVRARGWRVSDVKTRAFACQPEEILAGLRSLRPGPDAAAVVLWAVRLGSKPVGILSRRV